MKKLKALLFVCLIISAVSNIFGSYLQAIAQMVDRSVPFHSLGFQFLGLENIFKDVHTVGYYTDKDLDKPLAIAQFEQAQYMLAPTVLDLNHTQWRWVIFDCTTPEAGMAAIKRLGFTPLKMNNGIILAVNPNGIS